jgi:transcription initiation factor TFIIIB Brf1 subunit/transcription initiation factor TFIIB
MQSRGKRRRDEAADGAAPSSSSSSSRATPSVGAAAASSAAAAVLNLDASHAQDIAASSAHVGARAHGASSESSSSSSSASSSASSSSSIPPPLPPYRPGLLCETNAEILAMARRIASHLEADFDDAEAVKRTALLEAEKKDSQTKATAARAASLAGGTTQAAAAAAAAAALVQFEARIAAADRALEAAEAVRSQRYARNVREGVQRVLMQMPPAAGGGDDGGAGGAGASSSSSSYPSSSSSSSGSPSSSDVATGAAGIGRPDYAPVGSEGSDVQVLDTVPVTLVCANTECRNADESLFLTDPRQGDVICTRCGTVAVEHQMHDGDWTRCFEGEENTSQVGPPPDPLLSSRHNLRTSMAAGLGVSKERMRVLRLMTEAVEMGTSGAAGISDKRTRVSYMDRQKIKAAQLLEATCDRLDVPRPVLQRAKGFFAAFRESRQHVTSFSETLASCLVAAYEEAVYGRLCGDRERALRGAEEEEADETAAAAAAAAAAAPQLTEAELEERRKRRGEEDGRRQVLEDTRARALGLLGPTRMITGDEEEAEEDKGRGGRGAGSGAGSGAGAGASSSRRIDEEEGEGDDDEEEDEDEAILRRLEEQRRARGRATVIDVTRGRAALNLANNAAVAHAAAAAAHAASAAAANRPGAGGAGGRVTSDAAQRIQELQMLAQSRE